MTGFVMGGADPFVLLHHLALYGLADVLDADGVAEVKLRWEHDRPAVDGDGLDVTVVEQAVRRHLSGRRAWVEQSLGKERRGLMSPRLSVLKTPVEWDELQQRREEVLSDLTTARAWTDLRYLAALGEPCYWSTSFAGEPLQDDGASRLEMQPRNRGSEFVGNRLRPLITALLKRPAGTIAAGLSGGAVTDELGGRADSVSATGLATPGPVDNALVWCALWGIGQFPLSLRVGRTAATAGHLGRSRREWFSVPVWEGAWYPARLRSILASKQIGTAAARGLPGLGADDVETRIASNWLRARGVVAVLRFPVARFGSDKAPERRALRAEPIPLADRR